MRSHVRILAALGLSLLSLGPTIGTASAQQAQWSQFLGNNQHTSYQPDPAITTSNAPQMGVKWMANLFASALSSPVVAFNAALNKEVVYVGDERADVFALDAATGQVLWSTNIGQGDAIRATPAVGPDGGVWFGTTYNPRLYKLDGATGAVICSLQSPDNKPVWGSPMLAAPNGGNTSVFWDALDSGGSNPIGPVVGTDAASCTTSWTQSVSSGAWTTPSFGATTGGEPLVFVGTADPTDSEYAIDAQTGAIKWQYQTDTGGFPGYDIGAASTVSPAGTNGFADGVVYVSNEFGREYALDLATGNPIWNYEVYQQNYQGKRYVISSAALDGNQLVFGYFNGMISLNASTGAPIWNWAAPAGVDVSPAIAGPAGQEVVAFGDLTGAFRLFSLSGGSSLYSFQTGKYIVGSPAIYNGTIYEPSADGFLYAFTAGGGNGNKPSEAVVSPANNSTIPNPNGAVTISGTASDASSVQNVEVAVQAGGSYGLWYNGTTNSWQNAPYRNAATLSSPGTSITNWTYSLPVPPAGGSYEIFANAVNGGNLVDKGSTSYFTVSPSRSEPVVTVSTTDAPPGSALNAFATSFQPNETVTFTLLGTTVATAIANSKGRVPKTVFQMPANAPFGPTSLTLTGQTSGKSASTTLFVTNEWTQFGYTAQHPAQEPNDSVIAKVIFVGQSILNVYWMYNSGAPINTSPAVVNNVAYFGNDGGTVSSVNVPSGSPRWTYTIPSKAAIRSSPAIDPSGHVIFGANDGNLYVLDTNGQLVTTTSLGGNLGSPAYANGSVIIANDAGQITALSDPGFTANWSVNAGSAVTASPAYDAKNGIAIVGTASGAVIAYASATGAVKWSSTTGGQVNAVVMHDGAVYAGSADGKLYAYNESDGTQKWAINGDGSAVTAVAIQGNGPGFGTATGDMYDATVNGTIIHTRTYGNTPIEGLSSASIDLFATTGNGSIQLLRTNDGGWHYGSGSAFGAGPVVLDGMLFAGAQDGNLYALAPDDYTPPPQQSVRVGSVMVTVNGSCTPM
ncbi:MAG TPA: PQQ-binding-like beta-propeller repeat protein [Candidatus Baltobacteraceae bacterium]|nr:PQQ-binding-like beta-propeller repeat protein [Candidatus Baltobacteraceae bacterium]